MRAKFVRGQDPKEAMGIGSEWKLKESIDKLWSVVGPTEWRQSGMENPEKSDVEEYIRNLEGYLGVEGVVEEIKNIEQMRAAFEDIWEEKQMEKHGY